MKRVRGGRQLSLLSAGSIPSAEVGLTRSVYVSQSGVVASRAVCGSSARSR
jgi:hypothetical protein